MRVGLEGALGIQAHEPEEFLGAAGTTAPGQLLHLIPDQHGGVQGRQGILVDHGHLVTEQRAAFLGRLLEQILTLVEDFTRDLSLGVDEAHDGQGRDRLTAAGLAHEAHGLAGADLEGDVVDDVDVAVTLELDAQVVDLEQRGLLQVRLEAVGALAFDGLEVVEAGLQGLGLLSVGATRVEQKLVGLAVGVLVDLSDGRRSGSRHHGVGDALRQNVEAQDRDHDEQAREERGPPLAQQNRQVRRGLGQDVAPRGHGGRLEARTDEGQGGLEDDRVGHEHGREHEDRGGRVAHDVLGEDPGGAGAGDDHRADVVLTVGGHHVRANDARQLRDVDKSDRADDDDDQAEGVAGLGQRAPEDQDRDSRHGDTGHRHHDVHDAHDRFGEGLAHDRCNRADDRAEEEGDQGRAQTDHQRETSAVQDASEDVTADVVGSEQVLAGRGAPLVEDFIGTVGRNVGRQDRDEDDEGKEAHRDLRSGGHRTDTRETRALRGDLAELFFLIHASHRPNTRIDEQVEHVNDDVDDDERDRNDERATLHQGDPVFLDALEQDRLTHSIDGEDNFDDDRATHQVADAQAEDGHGRDERVTQHVAGHDDALGDAGADRSADVVAVQFLNH